MINWLEIEQHPRLEILMCSNEPVARGLGSKNSRFRLQNRIVLTKRSKSAIKAPEVRIREIPSSPKAPKSRIKKSGLVQRSGSLGNSTRGQEVQVKIKQLFVCEEE